MSTLKSLQQRTLNFTSLPQTETMTNEEYSFFLAYGMTQEEQERLSLLDVEMYNIMDVDDSASFEACDSSVLS
jgi:hypothetical protein